jgi:DNA polymerase-1
VRAKTGVEPSQIVDWLSLTGDSVDNIPGVSGVGPKTAAELLKQFGSVAALYERLDEVKPEKLRAALRDAADAVRRNRELVRLRDDLPCEFSADALAGKPADAGLYAGKKPKSMPGNCPGSWDRGN